MATRPQSLRRRLAPARIALHLEALAAVLAASAAIRLLPFARVVAARRVRAGKRQADVARLRAAVRAWSRRVPWRAMCFESAVALRAMLARRGVPATLHYGIAKEGELKAHVWLSVGDEVVLGGAEAAAFAEVAKFGLPDRR